MAKTFSAPLFVGVKLHVPPLPFCSPPPLPVISDQSLTFRDGVRTSKLTDRRDVTTPSAQSGELSRTVPLPMHHLPRCPRSPGHFLTDDWPFCLFFSVIFLFHPSFLDITFYCLFLPNVLIFPSECQAQSWHFLNVRFVDVFVSL